MLETLSHKQALADGVLDHIGNLNQIKLRSGLQAFLRQATSNLWPHPFTRSDGGATSGEASAPGGSSAGIRGRRAPAHQRRGLLRC